MVISTRNNGIYLPGTYRNIKITKTKFSSQRKYVKNPPRINDFKNQLQVLIVDHLKNKGVCLRTGKFVISTEIEYFLKRKYSITKRFQRNQAILSDLKIDVQIVRPESHQSSIMVSDFQIKLGNNRKVNYTLKVRI